MVYLLHAYFGRDGREEAEELLTRHSGDADKPRILGTFNEPISDWLSFFMFTYFTDRDGKFQLKSLAESGFDPLARTCRFMLTEEAHHMFVGETGVGRVVKRTLEVMKEIGSDDPQAVRAHGAIDLPTIQRYLNFWFTSSLDLFGSEVSSNAASSFANGIKGRPDENAVRGPRLQRRDATSWRRRRAQEDGEPAQRHERGAAQLLHQGLRDRRQALEHADPARRLSNFGWRCRARASAAPIGAWANVPTDPQGQPIEPRGIRPPASRTGCRARPTAPSCTA